MTDREIVSLDELEEDIMDGYVDITKDKSEDNDTLRESEVVVKLEKPPNNNMNEAETKVEANDETKKAPTKAMDKAKANKVEDNLDRSGHREWTQRSR